MAETIKKNIFQNEIFINKLQNFIIIYLFLKIGNDKVVKILFPVKMFRDLSESHHFLKFGMKQ